MRRLSYDKFLLTLMWTFSYTAQELIKGECFLEKVKCGRSIPYFAVRLLLHLRFSLSCLLFILIRGVERLAKLGSPGKSGRFRAMMYLDMENARFYAGSCEIWDR